MNDLRTAAQQALEALEEIADEVFSPYDNKLGDAILALRAALTETVEPVAWMVYTLDGRSVCVTDNPADFADEHRALPLYAAPPQRKPLNEDQMYEACINVWRNLPSGFGHTSSEWIDAGIRYAERAHGIIATEVDGDKS